MRFGGIDTWEERGQRKETDRGWMAWSAMVERYTTDTWRPMDKSADRWKDKRRVIAAVHASRSLLYICTV